MRYGRIVASRYIKERIIFIVVSRGDAMIAITGTSIIVRNPLDISDIILAILVLSIVYCNGKVCEWKGGCKFRFISKAHQISMK